MKWEDMVRMERLINGTLTLRETSGDRYRGMVTKIELMERGARVHVSLRDVKVSRDRGATWEDVCPTDLYSFDTASADPKSAGSGVAFTAPMLGQVEIMP